MASIFSTRIVRESSKEGNTILDAGCGDGIQSLYLARRNKESLVYGYDISAQSVMQANKYKQEHKIPNANFFVSSHDDFESQTQMDMIYTIGSLVGNHEIPYGSADVLRKTEKIVKERVSKFFEMLGKNGVYVMVWGAGPARNKNLVEIIESSGFKHSYIFTGKFLDYDENYEAAHETALIFHKNN